MAKQLTILAVVLVLVALTCSALKPQAPPSPPNWREVTVDGFQAGITPAQLKARLGRCEDIGAWMGHRLCFAGGTSLRFSEGSGFSLYGSRLEYRGRPLTIHCAADAMAQLGPGQWVPTVSEGGILFGNLAREELVYQAPDCRHNLVVRLRPGGGVESFALRWQR